MHLERFPLQLLHEEGEGCVDLRHAHHHQEVVSMVNILSREYVPPVRVKEAMVTAWVLSSLCTMVLETNHKSKLSASSPCMCHVQRSQGRLLHYGGDGVDDVELGVEPGCVAGQGVPVRVLSLTIATTIILR